MANSIINTLAWKKAALNSKAVVFNGGQIALNTDPAFVPSYSSVTADITEPSPATGYARQAPVFGAAVNFGVGDAQLIAALMTWTFTAGGFTIRTICQVRADGVLLWCFQLDTPVTIAAAGPWQFVPTYADGDY